MTDPAPLPAAPERGPWAEVLLAPLQGGTLGGFLALGAIAAAVAWLEGGSTEIAHGERRFGQVVLGFGAFAVAALYARRVALCTIEDRPVPWGRDERDATTWKQDVGTFAAILVMALLPALVLTGAASGVGLPRWLQTVVALLGTAIAAVHLPFALASSTLRDGALGAGWNVTFRAFRANPFAARIAVAPTFAFLALAILAFAVGGWLVAAPPGDAAPVVDHTTARDLGRALTALLLVASAWCALCSFRVAGLLARDVPDVREVLR